MMPLSGYKVTGGNLINVSNGLADHLSSLMNSAVANWAG